MRAKQSLVKDMRNPSSRLRARLSIGGSLTAISIALALVPARTEAQGLSSVAAAAALRAQGGDVRTGSGGGSVTPGGGVSSASLGLTAAQQAQVSRSSLNFVKAAAQLRLDVSSSMRTFQATARAQAMTSTLTGDAAKVTEGISRNGLWRAGAAGADWKDPARAYDVTNAADNAAGLVWQGASAPTQTGDAAKGYTVTIKQDSSRAILTWQNFDVGRNTTVEFVQRDAAGTPQRSWVALNRVSAGRPNADGSRQVANPSQILGSIRADGEVYIINPNGIIFGASSKVDVNALTASALDVGLPWQRLDERNTYFLTNSTGRANFSFQYLFNVTKEEIDRFGILKQTVVEVSAVPPKGKTNSPLGYVKLEADKLEGSIVTEAGALITTRPLQTANKKTGTDENTFVGHIVLGGPNVVNNGELVSEDGQVILAGTRNFSLYQNDGKSGVAKDSAVRGLLLQTGADDFNTSSEVVTSSVDNLTLANPYLSVKNPFISGSIRQSIFGTLGESLAFANFTGGAVTYLAQLGLAQGGNVANKNYSDKTVVLPARGGSIQPGDTIPVVVGKVNTTFPRIFINVADPAKPDEASAPVYRGSVTNTGLASTPRGSIIAQAGAIAQSGVVHATTSVNQNGLIDLNATSTTFATTRDKSPGVDFIDGYAKVSAIGGTIRFGSKAVTTILPDQLVQVDGTKKTVPANEASVAAFQSSIVRINTTNTSGATALTTGNLLTNYANASLVNQDTPAIILGAGSLLEVPSGKVSIAAAGFADAATRIATADNQGVTVLNDFYFKPQIIVEGAGTDADGTAIDGAEIDVSGLVNVVLPMSSNLVTVARVGQNELADSPEQRDGFIYRQKDIVVDRRLTGTRADGFRWKGTPLFDATGYINSRPAEVVELMTTGGSIRFGGTTQVLSKAVLNIGGGLTTYEGGTINTTKLTTADGRRTVDIGRADPFGDFGGYAGVAVENHAKWGVTVTYSNPAALGASNAFEPTYVEGGSAGSISFDKTKTLVRTFGELLNFVAVVPEESTSAVIFKGDILANAIVGPYQRAGSFFYDATRGQPVGGTLDTSNIFSTSIRFVKSAPADDGVVTNADYFDQVYSTDVLNASGLARYNYGSDLGTADAFRLVDRATQRITLDRDAALLLPDGGSLTLKSENFDIRGGIVARGGRVRFSMLAAPRPPLGSDETNLPLPRSSFTLSADAAVAGSGVIDVSGRFVNDAGATRDTLVGSNFINGGSITIETQQIANAAKSDVYNLAAVDLGAGTKLNLNSGGYIAGNNRALTDASTGLLLGRGGDLAIRLHQVGKDPTVGNTDGDIIPELRSTLGGAVNDIVTLIDDTINFNGSISAYGFQGGGNFLLQAPEITTGAGINGGTRGKINLTNDFVTGLGFGSVDLTGVLKVAIDPTVPLVVSQKQFLPGTGLLPATSVEQAATIGQWEAGTLQRTPMNLRLAGLGWVSALTHAKFNTDDAGNKTIIVLGPSPIANSALIIGPNSGIFADPGASISLVANGRLTIAAPVVAKGGRVTITQGSSNYASSPEDFRKPGDPIKFIDPFKNAALKSTGKIDVSGAFLRNSLQTGYRSGTLLAGGSIFQTGITAQPGAVLDVSGASDTIDVISGTGFSQTYVATVIASNAGTLYGVIDATLVGNPGGAGAQGGTLVIGTASDAGFSAQTGDASPATPFGNIIPRILNGSGFDALRFYGNVQFNENVDLTLGRSITFLGTSTFKTDIPESKVKVAPKVRLAAPYISITGRAVASVDLTSQVVTADGLLPKFGTDYQVGRNITLAASGQIDLAGNISFIGFDRTTLESAGDIRFLPSLNRTAAAINGFEYASALSANNLTLRASQIYPSTAVSATIQALAPVSNPKMLVPDLRIEQAGGARPLAPLSAGGSLLLSAGTIEQGGTLRAPLGKIRFARETITRATGTPPVIDRQPLAVSFLTGSLTSVAQDGRIAPYGETVNGIEYFYRGTSATKLAQLPEKSIEIDGLTADLQGGATLDLSGGGDVYATEFIPGLGGQRNVLKTSLTSTGTNQVYIIDPATNVTPGSNQLTIDLLTDVGTLKAGTYALQDTSYGVVPGAFRVELTGRVGIPDNTNLAQRDGTVAAAARIGANGTTSSLRTVAVNVQAPEVWQQFSSANSQVFAIIPGVQAFAAPVDPEMTKEARSASAGVVGQTIKLLSDVGALKAGTYTLLPGSYATLDGAYRVELNGQSDVPSVTNYTQVDGTVVVAGQLGVNGTALASRTLGVSVQSGDVWRKYTQITSTKGSDFFNGQAVKAGIAPAALPADAGRLTLVVRAVDSALKTGADLKFGVDSARKGRGGKVDIAVQKLAVVSADRTKELAADTAGYLVLRPQDIRNFNATSVLLGGTRVSTAAGDLITNFASDIKIATSASDPLTNPELVLTTSGEKFVFDTKVGNGLIRVYEGSVISAVGAVGGNSPVDLLFGVAGSTSNAPLIGDGALLRFSNSKIVNITRRSESEAPTGSIVIDSSPDRTTVIDGGQALQINASGSTALSDSTRLGGRSVELSANVISLLGTAADGTATVSNPTLQLLQNSENLSLLARRRFEVARPIEIRAAVGANRLKTLTIDTPLLVATSDFDGGAFGIDAAKVTLGNTSAFATGITPVVGTGILNVTGDRVTLTGGNRATQGFGAFNFIGANTISFGDGKATGILTLPGNVSLTTPLLSLADSATQTLATTNGGSITLVKLAGAVPPPADAIGGKLAFDAAGAVTIDSAVSARAGVFSARARTGDVTLGANGSIAATGYTQTFIDKDVVLSGGHVTLASDRGNVNLAAGSILDVSNDARGNGGTLDVVIGGAGAFNADGTIIGQKRTATGAFAAFGEGSGFSLDTNGSVNLDALTTVLNAGGFARSVSVRSAIGDLSLSNAITARDILFQADGGMLTVASALNADGAEGGTIGLFGRTGVDLTTTASISAIATDAKQRGGTVTIGTSVTSADSVDQSSGGSIRVNASFINLTDGRDYAARNSGSGGATLYIRAPIIAGGVDVAISSAITGARNVVVEGYRRYTTTNKTGPLTSGFDGVIDPAGYSRADGSYVRGTWRDAYGGIIPGATGPGGESNASYFTPEIINPTTGKVTSSANAAHINFYQRKLVNFVQDPGVDTSAFAGIANFHFQPGIELVNASPTINNGDIIVTSNWNFGAGSSPASLIYRVKATGEPGVLTVRALGDVNIAANISDGFYRAGGPVSFEGYDRSTTKADAFNPVTGRALIPGLRTALRTVSGAKVTDYQAQFYYGQFDYFAKRLVPIVQTYLDNGLIRSGMTPKNFPSTVTAVGYDAYAISYNDYLTQIEKDNNVLTDKIAKSDGSPRVINPLIRLYRQPVAPAAPTSTGDYGSYAATWQNYAALVQRINLDESINANLGGRGAGLASPNAPRAIIDDRVNSPLYADVANKISNNATAFDRAPVAGATTRAATDLKALDKSWSYRFAGGARTGSANPLATDTGAPTAKRAGDVTIGNVVTAATPVGSNIIVRTGTGNIQVAAARDVRFRTPTDSVYTAGVDNGFVAGFVDTADAKSGLAYSPATPNDGTTRTPGTFNKLGGDIIVRARGKIAGSGVLGATNTFVFNTAVQPDRGGADLAYDPTGQARAGYVSASGLYTQSLASATPATNGIFGGPVSVRDVDRTGLVSVSAIQSAQWVQTGTMQQSFATLGGGNIMLDAGGQVRALSVTAASTFQVTGGKTAGSPTAIVEFGGGNIALRSGGDVAGVVVNQSRGNVALASEGKITSDVQNYLLNNISSLDPGNPIIIAPSFSVANGSLSVAARTGMDGILVGGFGGDFAGYATYNATQVKLGTAGAKRVDTQFAGSDYSRVAAEDAFRLTTATGNISVTGGAPGTFEAQATRGNIDLFTNDQLGSSVTFQLAPSPFGNLDLLAYGDVRYYGNILMDDRALADVPSPGAPRLGSRSFYPALDRFDLHSNSLRPLHADDKQPARIVALNGDVAPTIAPLAERTVVVGDVITRFTELPTLNDVTLAKPVQIYAGRDIIDMRLIGQNVSNDSITSVTAGRDVKYTLVQLSGTTPALPYGSDFRVGGEGQAYLIAGRDVQLAPSTNSVIRGFRTIGNVDNPYLAPRSASANILFGVGGGIDTSAFIGKYLAPGTYGGGSPSQVAPTFDGTAAKGSTTAYYGYDLVDYNYARASDAAFNAAVDRALADYSATLAVDKQARFAKLDFLDRFRALDVATQTALVAQGSGVFGALPVNAQQGLAYRVFFDELRNVSNPDLKDSYLNYARANTAIDTLFSAKNGYTDNLASTVTPVKTGNLDMTSSVVRTEYGGDVNIIGPGGDALLGGLTVDSRPQGILTLRGGNINIFTDGNLTVNSSRIFTLSGGNITGYSANGNIDAGRGKKTSSFLPPLVVDYLNYGSAFIDLGGLSTGAGIGTLVTLPGGASGDVFLLAPRGDVDAGDAGIRSSGSLFVVALRVLNADNVAVGGKTVGVPTVAKPSVGALTQASTQGSAQTVGVADRAARRDNDPYVTVKVQGLDEAELERRRRAKAKASGN